MNIESKHVGLALQGGGAHGAFTWGVLDRLLEVDEFVADGICGTSAGAINAVVTAYGLHTGGPKKAQELLEELWYKIYAYGAFFTDPTMMNTRGEVKNSIGYQFFNMMIQHFSPYFFNPFDYNPLRKILLDLVDFEELRHYSKKQLFICATNVKKNTAKIFRNHEITVESVLASCCLPYLFQAIEIDGEHYWDGGFMGNPPIFPLIEETHVKDIILVKINSINIDQLPTTAKDITDRMSEISFNSSLINEMRLIHYRNELLRQGVQLPDRNEEVFIHAISGYEMLHQLSQSSKMNTSWTFLCELRQKGREFTDAWLEKHWKMVGHESSYDIASHFLHIK